jgi:hypothetical protein
MSDSLTLTARGVAAELGWLRRDGSGNADRIRALYRAGRFPPPIDPDLPTVSWMWSRRMVERYVEGEWISHQS